VDGQYETLAYRQFGGRSFELRVPAFDPVWDPGVPVLGTAKDNCLPSLSELEVMEGKLE
jgi:hypothetical protein